MKRRALCEPEWEQGPGWRYRWTINRDTQTFLIYIKPLSSLGDSGLDEPDGRSVFCFSKDGKEFLFTLKLAEGSSISGKERPYKTVWEWGGDNEGSDLSDEYLRELKEALSVYGRQGVRNHTSDFIVEFNF